MLKLMTARIRSMTLCVALAGLPVLGNSAQEQSVLQRPENELQLNRPVNNPLTGEGLRPKTPLTVQAEQESKGDLDLLTKGPLHEAFAEVQLEAPAPNPVISRQPPEAVKELPPKYRPDGENVEWIPGYWSWDEDRSDFLWISGIWRDIPPGQRWVPGYWETVDDGFRWINGFWMDDEVEEIEYLPPPPESLDNGPSTPAPSNSHFYAPGSWVYQENDYLWQPGYWMPRVENWVWVAPNYVWTPRGCVFRAGYWDRLFDCRGVVFAPVCYNRPIYADLNYWYTPSCVINTNFDLLPHLFVRRNCRSYYFGDWYDNRYAGVGFCAWSQLSVNVGFGRRCYDPFFAYYNHASIRYNNVGLITWARGRYDYCYQNVGYRPAALFNVNVNIINQKTVINGQPAPQPVVIADTLERRVKTSARRSDGREAFQQLAEEERREYQKRTEPIQTIARERKSAERRAARELAQSPSDADPVLKAADGVTSEAARPEKLSLPKIERRQQVAADKAAAELKRQQEKDERTARTEERRNAVEAANAARRESQNQKKVAGDNPPVLKRTDSSGVEKVASATEPAKPRANRGPAAKSNPTDGLQGTAENQPSRLTPDQRRDANAAKQQAQRNAQAERDAARNLARQQEAAAREAERAQRTNRSSLPGISGGQPSSGGMVTGQPNSAARDMERSARQAAEQQQRQQREMEMQQRRMAEQSARQAADQQRNAEMAMRRQQEAQDRAMRQQQEMQQRESRRMQDQMRTQQQQAREAASRQQRDMERQQRDMQRQQQQQERRNKKG